MPLHDFKCPVGHITEHYVDHGVDRVPCPKCRECTPECLANHIPGYEVLHIGFLAEKVFLRAPMTAVDYPGYCSPVDGRWVEGRVARREDLARNECIPYEPGMRQDYERRQKAENERFEASLDHTIEGEIHAMPTRKRELLEQELRSGADIEITRT